ncbi:UvrD-helicase domain-containing protein [Synechococcus sp. CS-1331]|uniref:UvrD-helicase domain-containing protein n=1 Tax=Synechococcus sp. CS-1331 TaxID=2847973 RepID=UPI00223BE1DF|nr:UvrD-helicase domain-containing protein [Synechococcus sp. CS-1331]MCT0227409.1 UvrD-helicase domain-containing protein [Synechococcus sp. CS-1331]
MTTLPPLAEQPFEANAFPLDPGIRLLEASAGTGKTFALAQLVLRYVAEAELSLRQLLVVTFTDAAAAELRDRIGQRLQLALACLDDPALEAPDPTLAQWLELQRPRAGSLRARLLLALEQLDAADITTIHGFCRRSLQRQALEAGLPPELQLESDNGTLVRQVAHDYWQRQVLPLKSTLLAGLQQRLGGPERLESLLRQLDGDPALQLEPLPPEIDADGPLAPQLEALWAGAWCRFQRLWGDHGRALEAAFCCSAGQWRALGIKSTTPYSPKPTKDRCGLVDGWIAAQPSGGDYGATAGSGGGAGGLLRDYFHPGAFLKLARGIEGERPSLPERPLLEAIAQVLDGPAEALLLHACHWGRAELNRRRRQSGRLGFAQLLEGLDPGEQASTPLLEVVGQRYAVALVDEFQDTDPIQWRILSRAFQPGRHRLVLVGDPKQAIYRFRGGELATYLRARQAAIAGGGISSLTDNYRSSEALIAGLNGLMRPGLRRSGLPVPPVQAKVMGSGLVLPEGQAPLQLLWLGGQRRAGQKPPSRSSLERQLPGQIASFITALLKRGLDANAICLLVSTHRQAEALRGALETCGIASRLVSQGDVFESAGATALQRLLDALAEPGRAQRLRLLAASPLLGWSAAQIAKASQDEWSSLAARLAQLAAQLPRRGLLGVLASLLEQRQLARLSLGGRVLADLQQCGELVAERIHSDQLGAAAAADWLRRLRLDPDRSVPDAHQPHSDGVDAAVSVVTVHRSKGLEYPVVICPYLWQAPGGSQGPQRLGVRWTPPHSGDPLLDLHLNGHWGTGHAARDQQLQAELQERERLAYVAATRAQQQLVLAWGPAQGQQGNPLHPWLFDQDDPPSAHQDPYGGRGDGEWRELLEQEIVRRQLQLTLVDPPAASGAPLQACAPEAAEPLQRGPVPLAPFDTTWGRSSYTSWTQASHSAAPEALEEGRETDALARELEVQPGDDPGPLAWPEDGPLASFPRGAQAGDCLHRILEQIDFRQSVAHQSEVCARELQRAGIAALHNEAVLLGLEQLLATPFGGELGGFQLAQLAQAERLNEMNFDLPITLVRASSLASPFAAHPQGWFGGAYAEQLARLELASQGFLTGSIDLVFRHGERWWVADWKSNWLGERDGQGQPLHCGPRHYGAAAMAALMATNHYPLQAHLYLVALHRYLRWRLPGYSPQRHLGGYAYVFLRGVPGATEAGAGTGAGTGAVPGVFLERPPLARLLQLDRNLGGPA